MKMLAALLSSAFSAEEITSEDIEKLKQKGAVEGMMEELASYLPRVKSVLIDERDQYLATKILQSDGNRVVAVVGAGHVAGIVRCLKDLSTGEQDTDLQELDTVPPPGPAAKIVPWILPTIIVGLIAWGFFRAGWDGGLAVLLRWILVNGTLSAIGALVALAHPVTIVASFLAAPFTSMNPTIGVGFVSATVEAVIRKPRVQDFEALPVDTATVRGFFRNRFTKILIVFVLSTIGSAIGTFIAIPFLFPS
jgi:pheromone shutdown-related protein TraB